MCGASEMICKQTNEQMQKPARGAGIALVHRSESNSPSGRLGRGSTEIRVNYE